MAKDLIFLYYLFSYSTGIIALIFSIFLYFNDKSNLIKKYIFVIISLLIVIAFGTISNYFSQDDKYVLIKDIFSFIMYLGPCILVYLLPDFVNDLVNFTNKRKINFLFVILSILMPAALIVFTVIGKRPLAHYFIMGSLGIATLYSIVLIFINFNKIQKQDLYYFMKQVAILTLVLFPLFIIVDYYRIFISMGISIKGPVVMPLLFSVWNILFIINAIRQIKNIKQPILEVSPSFINKYGISRREKEIIELLLNGMSYKEIMSRLEITMPTVKTHISNIYNKTKTNSKMKLAQLLRKG